MQLRSTFINGFTSLAWLFIAAAIANAAEGTSRFDLIAADTPEPSITASSSDGGLWIVASASGYPSQHQLLRLDANGNRTVALLLQNEADFFNEDEFALFPLADGGVLELDTGSGELGSQCLLRSITREGVVRFERKVAQSSCRLQLGTSADAPYLFSSSTAAVWVMEDGSLAGSAVIPDDSSLITAEFVNDEALVLHRLDSGARYVLTRFAKNGAVRWSNPLPGVNGALDVSMRGLIDGRAMLLVFEIGKIQQRFYSADGLLMEMRDIAIPELRAVDLPNWAQDDQGNHALVLEFRFDVGQSNFGALVFSPSGNFIKLLRYAQSDSCFSDCQLLGLANGFVAALSRDDVEKLVFTSPLPSVDNTEIELPKTFYLRIARDNSDNILIAGSSPLRAVSSSGVAVPAPSLLGKGIDSSSILGSAMAEDGKNFVLLQEYTDGEFRTQLEAFDANRVKIWQATTDNVFNTTPLLVADDRRVCWLGEGTITVKCYDSASGALLANSNIPLNLFGLRARVLSDGRLRMASIESNGLKIIDFSGSNQVSELSVAIERVQMIQHIGDSGSVLLATRLANTTDKFEWVLLGPNGQEKFRRSVAGSFPPFEFNGQISFDFTGQILENDDVMLASTIQEPAGFSVNVAFLNQSGIERWVVTHPSESNLFFAGAGKDVYLATTEVTDDPAALITRATKLQALSLTDGRTIWTQRVKRLQSSSVVAFPLRAQNQVLLAASSPLGVQLHKMSENDGQILDQRFVYCAAANCTLRNAQVDQLGAYRSISEAVSPGRRSLALTQVDTTVNKPQVRLDQLGISGAWYTPQLTGQGFFFEYFPQNKQLFAPWFTFEPESFSVPGLLSDSVSDLRWYSLSGTVEPNAKVAQLEIRSNVAGVFDSAPITRSSTVGTATLRAHDCNNATLEFKFNDNETDGFGIRGVLPLSRLTGGWAPCQTGANTTLPGRDGRPARGGFAGNQTGSWYAPQTSGQGFMFNVKPATDTLPGDFFGGWFTYDAGTPNDPSTQHWLALSATIPSNAQAGVLPVVIYRVLGGALVRIPTQNTAILGQGTISFSGCSSAVFRYQFNDAPIAGPFRAKTGQVNLQRLGACPE